MGLFSKLDRVFVLPLSPTTETHLRFCGSHFTFATGRFDLCDTLELEGYRMDRPAFEVTVRYSLELEPNGPAEGVARYVFSRDVRKTVLMGVEELQMDGFAGCLKPLEAELPAFLERMPALTRVITTDSNEMILRSVLDHASY